MNIFEMRSLRNILVLLTASVLCQSVAAQEDIANESGLPRRIGSPTCSNIGKGPAATLQGSLNVDGLSASPKPPSIEMAVYAGGRLVHKQRIKNGGAFNVTCIPLESVSIAVKINSVVVNNFSLGNLSAPPMMNRYDVQVTWSDRSDPGQQLNGVVSVAGAYLRTEENQKLFKKAADAGSKGNADEAIVHLKQIAKNDPNDFVAWTQLGNFYFNKGQFDDASTAFGSALAANGGFEAASVGAGRTYLSLKKVDLALEVLAKALELNPNSPDINHYLGEAYMQSRKGSLAIVHMRKAIELEPVSKAGLYLRIGALYNAAGAKELAAREYKLFLEAVPNHADKKAMEDYIKTHAQQP